jgi:SLOG in TRPM, prokaryote
VSALDVPKTGSVVVLDGGTTDFPPEIEGVLAALLTEGLARVVNEEGLAAITGATDAGVFALFGAAVAGS